MPAFLWDPRLGTCPLCQRSRILIQDHCHQTGLNRDRICQGCNVALGFVENNRGHKSQRHDELRAYVDAWAVIHLSQSSITKVSSKPPRARRCLRGVNPRGPSSSCASGPAKALRAGLQDVPDSGTNDLKSGKVA